MSGDHKTLHALRQLSGLGRSISHGIFSMTHIAEAGAATGGQNRPADHPERRESRTVVPNVMSATSVLSSDGSDAGISRTMSRVILSVTISIICNW